MNFFYRNKLGYDPVSANILIIDDDPSIAITLQRTLEVKGFKNIQCLNDPREVQDSFRKNPADIIVLDLRMPHLNGFEVIQNLHDEFTDLVPPILILTAHIEKEYRYRALDMGAIDFITKPFDMNELLSKVRNLLDIQLAQKYMREQNLVLESLVQERTRELHHTRLQIVQRLGHAAEYRDNETGLHIIRISKICKLLGQASGMGEYESDLLLNASPMHDIGKIGIPDEILLKPASLNADEWEIMKNHSQIGANILSGDDSELLVMAHDIALYHHEKWDGSGYPHGLKGEEIPLVGRIGAIADIFDALASDRPYKKAWSIDKTIQYIKEASGSLFDPGLVENFMKLLPAILQIKQQFAEPVMAA